MKAQLVKENIEFKREKDIKDALDIGLLNNPYLLSKYLIKYLKKLGFLVIWEEEYTQDIIDNFEKNPKQDFFFIILFNFPPDDHPHYYIEFLKNPKRLIVTDGSRSLLTQKQQEEIIIFETDKIEDLLDWLRKFKKKES